jgi:hypothetical protein
VLVIFLIEAIVMLLAFAYLFYHTTMTSIEDNRSLFVRAYLAMLIALAVGAYKLSTNANSPATQQGNAVKTEFNGQYWLPGEQQLTAIKIAKENGYV